MKINFVSAFVAFLLFFALAYGIQQAGIVLPCGVLLPASIGGLVVGLFVGK